MLKRELDRLCLRDMNKRGRSFMSVVFFLVLKRAIVIFKRAFAANNYQSGLDRLLTPEHTKSL